MKKELQEQLYTKYPKLFRQKDLSIKESCMPWGIDFRPGWYQLFDSLCSFLQWHIDQNGYPQVEFQQVKEKFGSMTIYWTTVEGRDTIEKYDEKYNYFEGAIDFAEQISTHTCEECGQPGKIRDGGWVTVLCDDCDRRKN